MKRSEGQRVRYKETGGGEKRGDGEIKREEERTDGQREEENRRM